ncbi:hypothetical protein [Kitasatospora sp. NPDC088783]|uniref:hypothetical protein n=1 Tax=Kitasatospora sp. NPDC088783 TaxID=3364077 RepID=UPI00381AB4D3
MGAADFTAYQDGTDVDQAFRDAVDAARCEYGSRSYTGTIAEKDDYQVVTDTPLTMEAAEDLAGRIMSAADHPSRDKRGPACAIPVLTDRRSVTVIVPFTPQGYKTLEEAALAILTGDGGLLPGETIGYCITGRYQPCPQNGRIRSGRLNVPLQGSPLEHRGWLFFGTAPY